MYTLSNNTLLLFFNLLIFCSISIASAGKTGECVINEGCLNKMEIIKEEINQISHWAMFEDSVTNPNHYENPYKDVQLNIVFTSSGGKKIVFWGFFDGDQTWRFRFMPDQRGWWKYEATFSDGTPGKSGRFRVKGHSLPGMLSIHQSNPIWFSGDVRPVLIRGLNVGERIFASDWSEHKRKAFLDWAGEQGYNLLSIEGHYLNSLTDNNSEWKTPVLWPLDYREYRKAEFYLDELESRHFFIYPYSGFFPNNANYPETMGEQELYTKYVLARFGAYWNVLLNVGSGFENVKENGNTRQDLDRMGRLIDELNVFNHPLSVYTDNDQKNIYSWTDYVLASEVNLKSTKKMHEQLLKKHHPSKPLLAQELLWPGSSFYKEYSDNDIRKNAYVLQMTAGAIIYGDYTIGENGGFSESLNLEDCNRPHHDILKSVWDLFENLPYFEMKPMQDMVSNGYCLAAPGRYYLVYLEEGGHLDVQIENGPYAVKWINTRNTKEMIMAGTTVDGKDLHTPDENDWLLFLTRTGTGLADQIHLSWQDDPSTSLSVSWHTISNDNPAIIEYRQTSVSEWTEAKGSSFKSPGDGWLHRVNINGLAPGTDYEYRVSNDSDLDPAMSKIYSTRTAPMAGREFSFAFSSDNGLIGRIDGNTTGTKRVMEEILKEQPHFILGGGDYAYANRDLRFSKSNDAIDEWFIQWQDVIATIPFMAQYGNHEIHLKEKYEDWSPRFAHPEGSEEGRNYSFDVGSVHFVSLFVPDDDIPDARLQWLENDLSNARQNGSSWIIVYHHEPIFAVGRSHPAKAQVRNKLAPIFEKYGVDLSISSHDQNYERTYPLKGVPDEIKVMSHSGSSYNQGVGTIYMKVSPGGKKSEIGNEFSRYTEPKENYMAFRETGFHHFAMFHLSENGHLKVEVFRLPDFEGDKSLVESFTLTPKDDE